MNGLLFKLIDSLLVRKYSSVSTLYAKAKQGVLEDCEITER